MSRIFCISFLLFFFCFQLLSQNTIGVLKNTNDAYEGYTLYAPVSFESTYLINNCGQVINQWESEFTAGLAAYLLPDGSLLRAGRNPVTNFFASGNGGVLEIFDWEGNLNWQAFVNDDIFGAHHDVEPTSYGSIFLLRWENKTTQDYINAGRDTLLIPSSFWMPSITEIMPIAKDSFDIIWEWHLFDHIVQDFDSTKENFASPFDYPRKVDINYNDITTTDWGHLNSIDYHEGRDEILLSVRNLDEIWIIDHSTNIAESASDLGGDKGLGGQLLYRYGNDKTYQDNIENQLFDGQHNAEFSKDTDLDYVSIQLFNNNNQSEKRSEIVNIIPRLDSAGAYALENGVFKLAEEPTVFASTDSLDFDSNIMSSAQTLPNGNLLINSGNTSKFFELDSAKNVVWNYVGPVSIFGPNEQGSTITGSTFRLQKYDIHDPIFEDLDVSIKAEAIELNSNLVDCGLVITAEWKELSIDIYPTLFENSLNILAGNLGLIQLECFDIFGRNIYSQEINGDILVETADWQPGIYIIKMYQDTTQKSFKVIKPNLR